MATIVGNSELLSKAVAFITEELAENPQKNKHALVDEAAMRFNLSPKEAGSLLRILEDEDKK